MDTDIDARPDNHSSFCALPDDVLLAILSHLRVSDLVCLRQTSRQMYAATKFRSVWHDTLHRQFLSEGIPVPAARTSACKLGCPSTSPTYSSLSQEELEAAARRAVLLRASWSSPTPQPTRRTLIDPTYAVPGSRPPSPPGLPAHRERVLHNLALYFLPGYAARYVLTCNLLALESIGAGGHPVTARVWCAEVWDTEDVMPEYGRETQGSGRKGKCVARMIKPRVVGWKTNRDVESPIMLAVGQHSSDTLSFFGLDLTASCPTKGFVLLFTVPGYIVPVLLQGTTLVTRDQEHNVSVSAIDLPKSTLSPCAKLADISNEASPAPLKVIHANQYATTLVREQSIEIFPPLSTLPPVSNGENHPELHPVPIPVIIPLAHHRLPWRLNNAHLAEIPATGGDDGVVPTLELIARFDSWYPWPVNLLHHLRIPSNIAHVPSSSNNLHPTPIASGISPYDPHPVSCAAWESPIELFAPHAMHLSASGRTVLFLDSGNTSGAHAQRVAARTLALPVGSTKHMAPWEPATAAAVEEEAPGAATVVFASRAGAGWTNVAAEEEQGVLALAGADGRVEIWEYAPLE